MYCAAHCAKATMPTGGVEDFPDEQLNCVPAGAIFEETLEDLNDMDRELLLFASGANLAAVRWLFVLGADKHASDSNGTTALHTSCRTGTLSIVRELVRQGIPLDVKDIAGWTPLHISIFMGRRDVVLYLLRENAPLSACNHKGQSPLDMCNDTWTREAIRSFIIYSQRPAAEPWRFEKEDEARQDVSMLSRLQYEPFFVPRTPVISESARKQDFFSLGQMIFNKRPGQGLAFLVASGCTRDYPVDLSFFLRRGKLDLSQIGHFLGESFSLSQTLRLEFINSVKFHGTSIVSGLAKVFTLLQVPPDLQKIDRLVHGVARIWWRQHDKISEEQEDNGIHKDESLDPRRDQKGMTASDGQEAELQSFELKQYLVSAETLYQLMFSVVMLHWNLYAPPSGSTTGEDRRLTMEQWLEINQGLEADGSDVPDHVLRRTYNTVRNGFIPQLTIRVSPSSRVVADALAKESPKGSPIRSAANIESWAWIVGHSFMSLAMTGQTKCTQILSIFSESLIGTESARHGVTGTQPKNQSVLNSSRSQKDLVVPNSWDSRAGKDKVWLSLCYSLLFLSASPGPEEAPYAFVHLPTVTLEQTSGKALTWALVGTPQVVPIEEGEATADSSEGRKSDKAKVQERCSVVVVFLLPDGRWQEFELPRLEVQVGSDEQLEKWVKQLSLVCGEAKGLAEGGPCGAWSKIDDAAYVAAA